jgi:1,4-dihydroxy-2-naphthoate octaprenyltransferase
LKKVKAWLLAARLRTLPLSVSGILVGTAMAKEAGYTNTGVFILAILTTIAYQITSNFANDYGDGVRGTDDATRIGPKRALQSGILSRQSLKKGILVSILVSIVLSCLLIYSAFESNWLYIILFFLLGLCSIWAAIRYTMGSSPYGYQGLGDLFVFLFFGIVAVVGSFFIHTKYVDLLTVLPAVAIGLLCVGVLNLNNLRDVNSDRLHGKNTLVVKMGFATGKIYHAFLLIIAFLCLVTFGILANLKLLTLIFLLPFVIVFSHLRRVIFTQNPENLDSELKKLALCTFFIALSFYISINYFS